MGVWRTLGYIFAGIVILGGFISIGLGASLASEASSQTGLFGNAISQLGSLALVYGGVSTIVLGILIIWALVKSGQIENIDKNIKIIAEWAKSQQQKESQGVQSTNDDLKPMADSDKKSFVENDKKSFVENDKKSFVENGVRYTKD